jgi:ribosomal-protein-alanine N-acetyltransferase
VALDGERNDTDSCAGVVLGCEIAPDYGFILQVAVRRERQGMGIGGRLIRGLAAQFRAHGMTHIALGVTLENPAVRLYRRLGFDVVKPVNAYVWWRP